MESVNLLLGKKNSDDAKEIKGIFTAIYKLKVILKDIKGIFTVITYKFTHLVDLEPIKGNFYPYFEDLSFIYKIRGIFTVNFPIRSFWGKFAS